MTTRAPAAFLGVGYSAIDRRSDRGILSYARQAAADALAAAGVGRDDVDGYVGIGTSPNPGAAHVDGVDEASAYSVVESLGIGPLSWASDVSAFPVTMAATAAAAIRAGDCGCVLGVRVLYAPRAPREADAGRTASGGVPGGRFAPRLNHYLERSGAGREDLWHVVRASREYARLNPVAYFRDADVPLEDYLGARMAQGALSLYDCDMPVCGAGAFVMVPGERAAESGRPAAYLRAYANWTNADTILERAGVSRRDIQVCQLYDGYSFMVYEWLERLGWCDGYAAWKFVADGETRAGGALPVNTFGGALGEGRLHGMGHLREGVAQVMGTAGARQVPGVENCLVQVGPFDRSVLALLSVDPGAGR
jgi:acetyl-CoA acetyltransferase